MIEDPIRIVDVVFARMDAHARLRIVIAIIAAAALYGLLGLWFVLSERPLADWGAEMALRVHEALAHEQSVELEQPPRPQPPPPTPTPPAPEIARAPTPRTRTSSAPPPPAQAGKIVAQEPQPNAPVDLTGGTFVSGTAQTYAGGVTTSSGTNTTAVHTRDVNPQAPPHVQTAPDHSATVALRNPDWTCPWPVEAEAEQIDQQVAMVRVVVDTDGSAISATIVNDPGHGFGQAAVECARRARFVPARDRDGHPIRAQSPPVRVRFIR